MEALMKQIARIAVLVAVLLAALSAQASAQKKPVVKKETPVQSAGTIRELMARHIGTKTNLGTIKSVATDFFVLDDDGVEVVHPLSTIHTILFVKDDDSAGTRMEIRLVGKD
jgi:predicted secreted Zn-dependent protease